MKKTISRKAKSKQAEGGAVWLYEGTHERIKAFATENGMHINWIANKAVNLFLDAEEKGKAV